MISAIILLLRLISMLRIAAQLLPNIGKPIITVFNANLALAKYNLSQTNVEIDAIDALLFLHLLWRIRFNR